MNQTREIRRAQLVILLFLAAALILSQLLADPEEGTQTDGAGWETPEDLEYGTFAVVTGSAYDKIIRDLYPHATIRHVSDWSDETLMVSMGRADALVREKSSIGEMQQEFPDLVPMQEAVSQLKCSWCTPRTDFGLKVCREVNSFIAELREEDMLTELYQKWENPETAPDHIEQFPMTGEYRGRLRIVSCLDWAPVSYQNGSNPCGYVIELAYRFCAWAGYEPVFEFVDIQSGLAGFEAGKYDLFAYGMEYTEEAAEAEYFTDVLMEEPVYAVVHRNNYLYAESADTAAQSASRLQTLLAKLESSIEKNFIRENRWQLILSGLGMTAALSALSTLLGTVFGAILCALRMSPRPYPTAFARMMIKVLQGTPIVMMLMVLYYVVFGKINISAFWICVLGFSLDFSSYASEIFRSGIEAVPAGQYRAAQALGFKPFEAFIRVVLPQAMMHIVPVYIGQLITTVKLTSVAGYISVQDLTRVSDIIRSRTYEAFFPLVFTTAVYFLLASLLVSLLKPLERRYDPRLRPRTVKGVVCRDHPG